MRILLFFLTVVAVLSCTSKSTHQSSTTSFWTSLKDSFPAKNLTAFAVDSQLQHNYKTFPALRNKVVDSVVSNEAAYLYSWQNTPAGFTAFTALVDQSDHGLRILYFVFDDSDRLHSVTHVANYGREAGMIYETRSTFIGRDTLLKISAASTKLDLTKPTPWPELSKSKGDSVFSHVVFQKDGRAVEKQVSEKKELNLE